MFKSMVGRITSAHVIAVVALVAALSGGAFAVGGPGVLQTANKSPQVDEFSTLAKVEGIGTIQFICDSGAGDTTFLRFKNTGGDANTIVRSSEHESSDYASEVVQSGEAGERIGSAGLETTELHIIEGGKQATYTVSTAGLCSSAFLIGLNSAG
jgi:hypothetical protein